MGMNNPELIKLPKAVALIIAKYNPIKLPSCQN